MEEILSAGMRLAAPLLLAALGELWVQRAGVVNIGIEGMMLTGAFVGFAVAHASGSPAVGTAAATAAGLGTGLLFAGFALVRRANYIVVGLAVNLLALGVTGLASRALYGGAVPRGPRWGEVAVPGLADLPGVGPVLFQQTLFVYAAALTAAATALGLARTRWGLRVRAVGESARAADAEGVPVQWVRGAALAAGGALAGLAGASLSVSQTHTFTEEMTAGRGFIALAIVAFGRWRPAGVIGGALFFGTATALQFRLQTRGFDVPYPVFLMLPYVLTLLVLALAAAGGRAPADLGRPYHRHQNGGRS